MTSDATAPSVETTRAAFGPTFGETQQGACSTTSCDNEDPELEEDELDVIVEVMVRELVEL